MKPDNSVQIYPKTFWEKLFWARICPAGGKHNIIRVRTQSDCWDECTKCGKTAS